MIKKDGNRIVKCIIVTREQDAQIKEIGRQIGLSDSAVIRLAVSQLLSERTQKTCEKPQKGIDKVYTL
nr:MAG TPA: antitoxin [Bacteriophage sp.]